MCHSVLVAGTVVNLTVHGVGPVGRALDPGEEDVWVGTDQFERVLDAAVGRPDVRLTFDDGNASDVEVVLPRLIDRGLTAEFFVLAGLLGKAGRLDAAGVRDLVQAGMSIGSHGWAHRDWRRLNAQHAREEFTEAVGVLSDLAGRPVSRVAIPFGSYDRHVLQSLREAGASRVYTSDGGRASPGSWLQPRTTLRRQLNAAWLERTMNGTSRLPVRARTLVARTAKRMRGDP